MLRQVINPEEELEYSLAMDAVRAPADKLEGLVGKKFWPFPTYSDILFYV